MVRIGILFFWFVLIFGFVASAPFWYFFDRKSINVCAWSGMFDLQWIARFEKDTGIKVNISYYDSNEELLVKLRTHGHGYDLILPSDYTINILRKKGMLKKLQADKIDFFSHLNPILLGHYFDEKNEYSIPFEWAVYGLGINKRCYPNGIGEASWNLIFDKELMQSHKTMMSNDPLVAVPITAFYLYGTMRNLTKERITEIKKVLKEQNPFIEAYTDFRANYYLASNNACIAVCSSSALLKSMREYTYLDFIIPQEGTLVTIENFAIPSTSTKEDLVYSFMNFMMKPESVAHSYEHMGFFPATTNVPQLDDRSQVYALLSMTKKEFERFHLLRFDHLKNMISDVELQNLWVQVKA